MGQNDRKKAQDVFKDTNYAFAEKSSFEKAFPTISDIKVKVIESGEGVEEWNRERYFSKANAGEYINCSNRLCYNGGFRLGEIIRYMESLNLTEYETSRHCQGYEGSPKGRKKYDNCYNRFDIKVEIKYKENVTV